jgi:hypothetical protein
MQPSIHIKKVKERYFDYSVTGPHGDSSYTREGLHSIAECLHDAATALGMNFKRASVFYGGVELGSWLVAKMEHETLAVAAAVHAALAQNGLIVT